MSIPSTVHLDQQLQHLHMAAVRRHYRAQAQAATQVGWPYEAYLAQLIQAEVDRRATNRRMRRIKEARFPLAKELADFDFTAIPHLNHKQVMELAQEHYLDQSESVLLFGNPGLGKTHIAIGLGLAACRQDRRVRFYAVTHLVNELQDAQARHQLALRRLGASARRRTPDQWPPGPLDLSQPYLGVPGRLLSLSPWHAKPTAG